MTEADRAPAGKRRVVSTVPLGTVINNNYTVTELLKIGGMGEVFRGENTYTGDPVAIKIVLQDLAQDSNITTLFRREARVLCGLAHPSVVRYFNFVWDEALGRYCLIMEYVDGTVLSDHVAEVAPLSVEDAMVLLRRLAGGLAEVHQKGVIHRDLSPDNVILRNDDIDGAVLIDFGIAKSVEMNDKTLHGQLAGKLKFISPEQLGHHDGEITPKTDIYGLALLIAYALEGKPLPMGDSVVEAVNLRRTIPDIRHFDPRLRAVLAHMLEPDPADRPADMTAVADLLDHPSRLPEKYRPLGPKVKPGAATDAALDAVFQPPKVIPGKVAAIAGPEPVAPREGGLLRWAVALGLIAVLGWLVADRQGWIGETEATAEAPIGSDAPLSEEDLTRGAFLANYVTDCGYATRITSGPQTGTIAAFAGDPAVFDDLPADYEATFDAAPAITTYPVSADQCPVADLARALRSRDSGAPLLVLDSDVMQSNGTIVGRLSDRRGRPVWLALVTEAGGVYNLTDRLVEQPGGGATFTFGLSAEGANAPQGQILVAVASQSPLIAAAAATDGTVAASLLPLIEAEIAGRDGRAGIALAHFTLAP